MAGVRGGARAFNGERLALGKLVGEAHKSGMLGAEEAEHLSDIPNVRQKGSRMGIG
jgi:hypothetical protein